MKHEHGQMRNAELRHKRDPSLRFGMTMKSLMPTRSLCYPVGPHGGFSAGQQRSALQYRIDEILDHWEVQVLVRGQMFLTTGIDQIGTVQRIQVDFTLRSPDAALVTFDF